MFMNSKFEDKQIAVEKPSEIVELDIDALQIVAGGNGTKAPVIGGG